MRVAPTHDERVINKINAGKFTEHLLEVLSMSHKCQFRECIKPVAVLGMG
jgi:hypothetical protein